MSRFFYGVLAAFIGGLFNGSWAAPLAYLIRMWNIGTVWLIYSISVTLCAWFVAGFQTIDIADALSSAVSYEVVIAVVFSLLWGVSNVFFGISVTLIGQSLTYAIVLGIASTLGSFLPLVIWNSSHMRHLDGVLILIGLEIMIIAIVLIAIAGKEKETELKILAYKHGHNTTDSTDVHVQTPCRREIRMPKRSFYVGLVLAIATSIGALSFNFGIIFAKSIGKEVILQGSREEFENALCKNAFKPKKILILLLLVLVSNTHLLIQKPIAITAGLGGMVMNIAYAIILMTQNGSWRELYLIEEQSKLWQCYVLSLLMGVLWYFAQLLYGIGAAFIGNLGTSVGWAIFFIATILAGQFWGVVFGEWREISRFPKIIMCIGVALLILASGAVCGAGFAKIQHL